MKIVKKKKKKKWGTSVNLVQERMSFQVTTFIEILQKIGNQPTYELHYSLGGGLGKKGKFQHIWLTLNFDSALVREI